MIWYVPTVFVSTVSVVVAVCVPDQEASVAVAPASVQVPPNSTISLPEVIVTTGAVVSITETVLEAVPVLEVPLQHQSSGLAAAS